MKVHHGVRVSVIALGLAVAACSSMKNKVEEPVTPVAAGSQPARPATPAAGSGDAASTSAAGDAGGLSANGLGSKSSAADKKAAGSAATGSSKSTKAGSSDGSAIPEQSLLHFEFDSYAISASDSDILAGHAAYLAAHRKAHVRLEGHADERGTQEYNMALGEKRAKAARFFLVTHGVRVTQLDVISYGKTKPLDTGSTEEAWAKNRRVEIVYR